LASAIFWRMPFSTLQMVFPFVIIFVCLIVFAKIKKKNPDVKGHRDFDMPSKH